MITTVASGHGYSGATVHLDIDKAEHERRQGAGLGVATGRSCGSLNVLTALTRQWVSPGAAG